VTEEIDIMTIVKHWLKANGYDGLCDDDVECGCQLADLMPCDDPSLVHCVAGYREERHGHWIIVPGKTPSEKTC